MNEDNNESIIGINHVLKYEELAYNLKNPLRVEPIPFNQINVPSNDLIPVLFHDKNTNRILNFLIEIIKKYLQHDAYIAVDSINIAVR